MNMVIPNEGKERISQWAWIQESASFGEMAVRLFVNDYTPDNDSTYSDFTFPTFVGSDSILINRADWDGPDIISNVAYVTLPDPPEWTVTSGGGEIAYGWVLWDTSDDIVIAAQRFATPRTMSDGSTETLDPYRIGLKSIA